MSEQEEELHPLLIEAQSGNLAEVKRLVAENTILDLEDADGTTALIGAAFEGHAHVVRHLLDAGAKKLHR